MKFLFWFLSGTSLQSSSGFLGRQAIECASIWGVVVAALLCVVALEYSFCPSLRKRQTES